MIIGTYRTRKGASGTKPIRTADECERFLKTSAYESAEVTQGDFLIGERYHRDGEVYWSYDKSWFDEPWAN